MVDHFDWDIGAYLAAKPEAQLTYPFMPDVPVYKVCGKMFALMCVRNGCQQMNLKCDPLEAQALRDVFEAIQPGYHMNKRHWNTIILDGSVPVFELQRMIDRSYGLVVKGLTKAQRRRLEIGFGEDVLYR